MDSSSPAGADLVGLLSCCCIAMIWLIPIVLGISAFAFWLWMLIDCATLPPRADNDKIMWILIILFTHFIGALIYFFVARKRLRSPEA